VLLVRGPDCRVFADRSTVIANAKRARASRS